VAHVTKEQLVASANEALAGIESLPCKRDLAKRYGVSMRTVDRWVAERRVPYLKFGHRSVRFRWPAVEKALDKFLVREVK
jgi:excisionase family DNA binding protein